MLESQVRALFMEIADGEPDPPRVDTELAHRRGRARLRWRRASLAGTPVLAAATVAALVVAGVPFRPGTGPVTGGPAAPRQFNPLVPYVSFGWLPAGNSLVAGDTSRDAMGLAAGRQLYSRSTWNLNVAAAGRCHLTGPAGELKCSGPALAGLTARITGRAPAVRGRPAFWAAPALPGLPHSFSTPTSLVWQYGPGAWAGLGFPSPYDSPTLSKAAGRGTVKRDAVKIAVHVRFGAATPPLVFPVQLTHLPGRWRVSSVFYLPDARVLRVERFALGTGTPNLGADGGLVYETGLPWFFVDPATRRTKHCYAEPHRSIREIINGYRVVVTHQSFGRLDLCAGNADGLSLYILEFGPHPAFSTADIFGHHMRLLGADPANWTRKPIG
jgi:hypothetical protein